MLTDNSSKELHGLPQITQSYAENCIEKLSAVISVINGIIRYWGMYWYKKGRLQ